jgi:D-alanine transaminase
VIVHLNGQLLPLEQAKISPLDRGFIFGDGVYEGLRSVPTAAGADAGTRIIGLRLHVRRMQAGLDEAGIAWDAAKIGPASLELLKANGMREAFVYWQVTRGTPPAGEPVRSRVPARNSAMRPTVFGYCSPQPPLDSITTPPTKRAITCRDIRWELGHLKSISLMGNVIAAMQADAAGADEAILIRPATRGGDLSQGVVSEGLATNVVLALPRDGGGHEIVTPSLESASMLAGVTRAVLLRAAPEIAERPVMASELSRASEVMYVGTTTLVTTITHIDGRAVGDGSPGPVAKRLLKVLVSTIKEGRDDW